MRVAVQKSIRNVRDVFSFGAVFLDMGLVKRFLGLYRNRAFRLVLRFVLIFASSCLFLLLTPFYPLFVALLFGVSLAAIGLRYPRGALFLTVLLSIPTFVYQEVPENPLFIAYLFICVFLFSAVRVRWVNGALVLLSLGLAFTPQLSFLAFVPVLAAGLMFSLQDGALVGLCASCVTLLFLIVGAPNPSIVWGYGRQAGLISISASSSMENLFQKQPIQNFQPISLIQVFKNYVSGVTAPYWLKAFTFTGGMLEKFLYDVNLWVIPALWCVSGYLASKSAQWYGRIVKFPIILASATATIFPIAGYLISGTPANPYLVLGSVAVPILLGFAATPIHLQTQMRSLQNEHSALKTKIEKVTANISKMAELGYNTKSIEKSLTQIRLKIEGQNVEELFRNKTFHEALTILKGLADETAKIEEEAEKQLNKIGQLEDKIRNIENNVEKIKSSVRKSEMLFQPVTMTEERKELEQIQKSLAEARNTAKKGFLDEALNRLEGLKIKSETLNNEVSEIYEFWSHIPQWSQAIEERLTMEGKADLKAMSEIPDKWKDQAAKYFLKESADQELTIKNGVIYSSKAAPQLLTEATPAKGHVIKPLIEEIDEKVFQYIQDHQGTISIKKALEELKISEAELRASIMRLKEKKLIE